MDHVCFLSFLPHNIYCTFLLCVLTGHTHTHPLLYAIKNVCPRSTKTVIAKNETETRCKALSLSLIHKNRNYLDLYRFATIKLILSHTQLCFKRNASPLPPSTSRKKTTTPVTLPRHREECNFFKLTKGTRRALYRYTYTHTWFRRGTLIAGEIGRARELSAACARLFLLRDTLSEE